MWSCDDSATAGDLSNRLRGGASPLHGSCSATRLASILHPLPAMTRCTALQRRCRQMSDPISFRLIHRHPAGLRHARIRQHPQAASAAAPAEAAAYHHRDTPSFSPARFPASVDLTVNTTARRDRRAHHRRAPSPMRTAPVPNMVEIWQANATAATTTPATSTMRRWTQLPWCAAVFTTARAATGS